MRELTEDFSDHETTLADGKIYLVRKKHLDDDSVIAFYIDISERKESEMATLEAKESAEFANRAKSEFLANMSHELRSPLTAILGYTEAMQEGIFGPIGIDKYDEYLEAIHSSSDHLLELVNDILDVAAIEAGHLIVTEELLDLKDIAQTCIRMIRPRALQDNVILESSVAPSLPKLCGDMRRIKQILINLLSNAVKFTPEGGSVMLNIGIDKQDSIYFAVSDTGIGMSPEEVETALQKFGQVESSISRSYAGAGLGLPLTIKLVESHQGKLEIKSEPNTGTTVTIRFPKDRSIF